MRLLSACLVGLALIACNSNPDDRAPPADPIETPVDAWTWVPVDGSQCGSGSTAGIGMNRSATDEDLFIYLQGGGACWNQGTCAPSLLQFGPICSYGNFCIYDGPGGTQPTAVYVKDADPFPADGSGFRRELANLSSSRAFLRDDASNPFRAASYVFVPYCTGDLHSGRTTREYSVRNELLAPDSKRTVHFAGATNMEHYLARLKATFPNARRIWLTGTSAGGYGATLNFERVQRAFPEAAVQVLSDSAPLVANSLHWDDWREAWDPELPESCDGCEEDLSTVGAHLSAAYPDRRFALITPEQDPVIAYFAFGANGPEAALSPPLGTFEAELAKVQAQADTTSNARYFVVAGQQHGLWLRYGSVNAEGQISTAAPSRDGSTDLKRWIDAWATGEVAWESER